MSKLVPQVPDVPKREITAFDFTLLIGAPLIAYVGGIASAGGHFQGLILSGFAALAMITALVTRRGRLNEPRVPRYANYLIIAVAVVTVLTAWNCFRAAPLAPVHQYWVPAIPCVLFLASILLVFRRRR